METERQELSLLHHRWGVPVYRAGIADPARSRDNKTHPDWRSGAVTSDCDVSGTLSVLKSIASPFICIVVLYSLLRSSGSISRYSTVSSHIAFLLILETNNPSKCWIHSTEWLRQSVNGRRSFSTGTNYWRRLICSAGDLWNSICTSRLLIN